MEPLYAHPVRRMVRPSKCLSCGSEDFRLKDYYPAEDDAPDRQEFYECPDCLAGIWVPGVCSGRLEEPALGEFECSLGDDCAARLTIGQHLAKAGDEQVQQPIKQLVREAHADRGAAAWEIK